MGTFLRLTFQGVRDLLRNPWPQALTLAALTLTAFLGGLFALFLHNLDAELLKNQGKAQFQIYWKIGAGPELVRKQWDWLKALPNVAEVTTFGPDQALDVLKQSLGEGVDFSWLKGESPLPYTALAYFRLPEGDEAWTRAIYDKLKGMDGVEAVHFNPMRLDLAQSFVSLSSKVIWPLGAFLVLLVALVVGNTLKLSLLSRKDEVEILHLVGAKRWYIRLPLLAGGATQGFLGGVFALGLLKIMQESLKDVLNIPPLWIKITYLPLRECALLLGVMTLVAVLSSWVAVRE